MLVIKKRVPVAKIISLSLAFMSLAGAATAMAIAAPSTTIQNSAPTEAPAQTDPAPQQAATTPTPQPPSQDPPKDMPPTQTQPHSPDLQTNTSRVQEQFNGSMLDTSLWEAVDLPKGYRNNEEQSYSPSQVKVADGTLQITAIRDYQGVWRSGEVHSKWNYTYGDFEVRIKLSATGTGVWPAAWLMGTTDNWPNGGEIDIFESINSDPMAFSTIHGGGERGAWRLQDYLWGVDVTQFHTYKISKKPGVISWWVDGIKQGEWLQSQTPDGAVWPFEDHSNFGLLNLAIGGNWPGPSNNSTPDSITMYVDYFSVTDAF